jgi:2-polyprenyl-3-methyl-5-hydroxy-6-metoxy-1,4-benzoquinol methylase
MATCDFCKSTNTSPLYKVPTSLIGSQVMECKDCGLVQSVFKNLKNKHRHKSISCGADWGNVRHGKKIRLNTSINIFKKYKIPLNKISVLDVGSNRGHFTNYILTNFNSTVTAIEPDSSILQDYKHCKKLNLQNIRFENFLSKNKYDLVYCCHTLEHVTSACNTLLTIRKCMKDNGYLYIDVPSIQVLQKQDAIEEFFIDKHTFHFSKEVLENYLKFLGFKIIYSNDDTYNITILAQKKLFQHSTVIKKYNNNRKNNLKKLKQIGQYINKISTKSKVTLYGASKIYDALVKFGKLNLVNISYVVDDYLQGYLDSVHGKKLTPFSLINRQNTDVVIILTRSATDKLAKQIKKKKIQKIIKIQDLLGNI